MKRTWCVRHREGWCAVADGKQPAEEVFSVPTACAHFVLLPGGTERRVPTCLECLAAIEDSTRAT